MVGAARTFASRRRREIVPFRHRSTKFRSNLSELAGGAGDRETALPVPSSEAEAKQFLIHNMNQYDIGGAWPEAGSNIWGGHAGPPPYDFRKSSYADTSGRIGAYGEPRSVLRNNIFM